MLAEEQKEEKYYQPRSQYCDLFLSGLEEAKMNFTISLKKNADYKNVYSKRKSFINKYLIMYVCENNLLIDSKNINRIGISVSKKVGNSVVRHRIKRVVKEVYRLHENIFNSGLDIVIVAREGANGKSYKELESAFLHLSKLHHIVNNKMR